MLEEWKPVEGFEDRYKVSSKGRVYSLNRNKILKPKQDKDGYYEYALWDGVKSSYRRAHRLVATHFIANTDNHPLVNHKDEDKINNCVTNLEWCTVAYNTIYSIKNKLPRGLSALSSEDFKAMVSMYQRGSDYKDIVEFFKLDIRQDNIGEVLSGRRLSEISGITEDLRRPYVNPAKKLSEDDVVNILTDKYVNKLPQRVIASKYSISEAQTHRIVKGTRWPETYKEFMEVVYARV